MNESQRLEDKNYEAALKVITQAKGVGDYTKELVESVVAVIFGRGPEAVKVEFQAGDVVECVAEMSGAEKAHGRRGIIIAKEEENGHLYKGDWVVEFFDVIAGSHGCRNQVPSERGFWMRADTLKLVSRVGLKFEKKSVEPEVKFQVGDIVEATSPQDGRQVQGLRGIIVGQDRASGQRAVRFFDKFANFNTCHGLVTDGYGLFIAVENLRLILRPNLSVKENAK